MTSATDGARPMPEAALETGAVYAFRRILSCKIPSATIFSTLILWFGISQILLWRFLGAFSAPAFIIATAALVLLSYLIHRSIAAFGRGGPSAGCLLVCFLSALILLALAGEGRMVYANIDWQVRDAVFRDISINPWPFVYTARLEPDILRGAIGMYLLPSLVYKAMGPAAGDMAILGQNSLLLALILALGSSLFETGRARLVALVVFVFFSGLDVVGQLISKGRLAEHLEWWAGLQYSSHVTLLFWTPQYAIAGWLVAIAFMLHQVKGAPLGLVGALALLTALWSPLTLIGIAPFAATAGVIALRRRSLKLSDFAIVGLAAAICAPAFLYLGAANDAVGLRFYPIKAIAYVMFQSLETLPYLLPLAFIGSQRFGGWMLAATAAFLMAAPFIQIGYSTDFMMRGVIPPQAILAIMTADALTQKNGGGKVLRLFMAVALSVGALTGLFEIRRAFAYPPSPRGACTFFKAWDQSFSAYPKDTHLAPLSKMPALIRPSSPTRVSSDEPEQCWIGEWRRPSGF